MKYRLSLALLCFAVSVVHGQTIITNLPFSADLPDTTYELRSDMTFNGSQNAITINADGVVIDLGGHKLMLSDPAATGILVSGNQNFTIQNGYIKNQSNDALGGAAIRVVNAGPGIIQNINTFNHNTGLKVKLSHDLVVKDCLFRHSDQAAACVRGATDASKTGSKNIEFDGCVFQDAPHGLFVDGLNNKDFTVKKCQFPHSTQTDLLVLSMSGMVVEDSSFTHSYTSTPTTDPNVKQNMIQFGGQGDDQWVNAAIIKNCTVINEVIANYWIEGINVRQGFNCVIDSCTLSMSNWDLGYDEYFFPAAIHLGSFQNETYSFSCVVKNCTIGGFSLTGIFLDAGYGHTIEWNTINDMSVFGLYQWDSDACTVRNNVISNIGYCDDSDFGDGIYVDSGEGDSQYNIYNDNTISNCSRNGITIDGATWNLFQHNQSLFNNDTGIYNDNEGDGWNKFLFNVSYGNCTDFSNVNPLSELGTPPVLPGENIYTSNDC